MALQGIPVSDCPRVPACKQPTTLVSSFLPPSRAQTGRRVYTYSQGLNFLLLSTLAHRLEVPKWIPRSCPISLDARGYTMGAYLHGIPLHVANVSQHSLR